METGEELLTEEWDRFDGADKKLKKSAQVVLIGSAERPHRTKLLLRPPGANDCV